MDKYEIYDANILGIFSYIDEDKAFGFTLQWDGSPGFGQIRISQTEYQEKFILHIDSESMGREFVKAVLNKMVDDAVLDCDDT